MSTLREAAQQAIEALKNLADKANTSSTPFTRGDVTQADEAIATLEAALAQPENEPSDRGIAWPKPQCLTCGCWSIDKDSNCDYCGAGHIVANIVGSTEGHDLTSAQMDSLVFGSAQQVACSTLPERDTSKPAEQQGLFRKFVVHRVDGSDQPNGKHHGCEYFVLDVNHDQHAPAALRAYAEACVVTHPQLSTDLQSRWGVQPAEHQTLIKEMRATAQIWEGYVGDMLTKAANMLEAAGKTGERNDN